LYLGAETDDEFGGQVLSVRSAAPVTTEKNLLLVVQCVDHQVDCLQDLWDALIRYPLLEFSAFLQRVEDELLPIHERQGKMSHWGFLIVD
jgi:hypothetical protein